VFESIKTLTFTAAVIEYNPTIPIGIKFKNPVGRNVGNSSTAILDAMNERGYSLVHQTRTNLIFMAVDVIRLHHVPVVGLVPQWHLFFGYDGRMYAHNWNHIDAQPFYPMPWGLGYVPQPLPNVALRMGSRWRNILGLMMQAPWMFIRFPASYGAALAKMLATKVTDRARRNGLIAARLERACAATEMDCGRSVPSRGPNRSHVAGRRLGPCRAARDGVSAWLLSRTATPRGGVREGIFICQHCLYVADLVSTGRSMRLV